MHPQLHGQGKFLVDFACPGSLKRYLDQDEAVASSLQRMKKSTKPFTCFDFWRLFIRPMARVGTWQLGYGTGLRSARPSASVAEQIAHAVRTKLRCTSTMLANHALSAVRWKDTHMLVSNKSQLLQEQF